MSERVFPLKLLIKINLTAFYGKASFNIHFADSETLMTNETVNDFTSRGRKVPLFPEKYYMAEFRAHFRNSLSASKTRFRKVEVRGKTEELLL